MGRRRKDRKGQREKVDKRTDKESKWIETEEHSNAFIHSGTTSTQEKHFQRSTEKDRKKREKVKNSDTDNNNRKTNESHRYPPFLILTHNGAQRYEI